MRPQRNGRRLGQNYLTNGRAAHRIVEALAPRPGEPVLEIGPGRGALTAGLIEAAGRITAVELDERLCRALRSRFDEDRLLVLQQDILEFDLSSMPTGLAVAGNLPYNISKPIAMKLIVGRDRIDRAVLMFQKEVADRLTASVGCRSYSPLTVLAGQAFAITKLFDLPASAFRPRPKVTSTVTLWQTRKPGTMDRVMEEALRSCLSASFARRRQTLRNNLRAALGSAEAAGALLEAARLDGSLRAEAVPPEGFVRLAKLWRSL